MVDELHMVVVFMFHVFVSVKMSRSFRCLLFTVGFY